ncbi:major facilitator superfamily domain-containing protein [Trichoderma compactum]
MGAGKPYPPDILEKDGYIVEFDGADDPIHPQNWPMRTKAIITAILSITTFITTFASGIYAPAISTIATDYKVAPEVATLGVTLYVLGFSAGPVLWGPLSEIKGRRQPLVVAAFGTAIFYFAVAVSKDVQSIMINRFFAGHLGTSPLAVGGAVFVDLFDNKTRGIAVTMFTLSVFIGPMFSPFIGGFIVTSHLGWRWTQYLSGILASAAAVGNFLFVHETYPPIILARRAAELRRRTKNWAIHAKQEETEVNFHEMVDAILSDRFTCLFIYSAFIYGLRYLFLTAYPIIFQGVYGMRPGISGLPELGAILGCIITGIIMVLRAPIYRRKLEANNNMPVPEWRLPEAMVGAVLFAGGIFWLGWSGYQKEVHWIVPTIGGVVTGLGISMVFLQAFNYLIDAYLMICLAVSALAANTFLRSLFGAIFPLFASYMFKGMGIQWAMSLLGCVAALLAPVPVIFYIKGAQIRKVSKYTPKLPLPVATSKRGLRLKTRITEIAGL